MKKRVLIPLLLLPVLGAAGWYGYRGMMARRAADETVLPEFVDLPPGPRAKITAELGVEVGKSRFDAVKQLMDQKGWSCRDTSVRALMQLSREQKKKEKEEKEARGEPADTVTSASAGKKSPMEKNPQLRWSCEETASDKIGDRERPPAVGRVLFVFDSADHPIRHASYRRQHKSIEAAIADVESSRADFVARFGEPTDAPRAVPAYDPNKAPDELIVPYDPYNFRWTWADLTAVITIINYGKRGLDVFESVEVPWPVRSDAPSLPPDYVAKTPPKPAG